MIIQSQVTQNVKQDLGTLTHDQANKIPQGRAPLETEFPWLIDEQYNFITTRCKLINSAKPPYIFITSTVTITVYFTRSYYLADERNIENFNRASYRTNVDVPKLINSIAKIGYSLKFLDNGEYSHYKYVMAKLPEYQ